MERRNFSLKIKKLIFLALFISFNMVCFTTTTVVKAGGWIDHNSSIYNQKKPEQKESDKTDDTFKNLGTSSKESNGASFLTDIIYYAADAKVIHSHNYNCRQQFHRNFDLAVSQADHPEIFEGVPSEGEGMRLVKDTAKYLLKSGRPWLLVSLVCKSGWKYMGYKLGKNYKKLPRWLILKCTMNPRYWRET